MMRNRTDSIPRGWRTRTASFASTLLAVTLAAGLGASGCDEPTERAELESTVDYFLQTSPDERTTKQEFLNDLENGADRSIRAALAGDALTSEVADRLVSARDSGIEVEVVADEDDRSSEPVQTLLDNEIPVRFGDGSLDYVPNPSLVPILGGCTRQEDRRRVVCSSSTTGTNPCGGSEGTNTGTMCRPGSYNRMSHRFVLIDEDVVWSLAGGLETDDGGPMAWRAESELLHEDFNREFRQLFGGTFATTLDAYNGPLKSTGNDNLDYMTDRGVLQIRFNPQERLLKHVIDEVYRARSSIEITTPILRNPFLLDALEYKSNHGFEVSITVGSSQPDGTALDRLKQLDARQRSRDRPLPTIVVVDGDNSGRQWPRTGLILSHPLIYSRPYRFDSKGGEDRTLVYPSDHFADGALWTFFEYSSNAGGNDRETSQLDRLESFVDRTHSDADTL